MPVDKHHAYTISDLAGHPFSRAKLYQLISSGRLPARKLDGCTVVLHQDWIAFLDALPVLGRDLPTEEPACLQRAKERKAAAKRGPIDTTATRIA